MAPNSQLSLAEVEQALRYLAPPAIAVEFPSLTDVPHLSIAKDEVWSHIHEFGFVDLAKDAYEREAGERAWRAWDAWVEDRQGEWPTLLAGAAWSPDDLRLWAEWFKRQNAEERARWEARLGEEPAWWRRVADAEPRWWEGVNASQSAWLPKLLEDSRDRRKKGFLGRLAAPDEEWGRWFDRQGEARLAQLDAAWQAHRAEVLGTVQRTALKQEFFRQVAADQNRQLRELGALGLDQARFNFWLARVQVAAVTYAGWREFQDFWAQFGAGQARDLLARPGVRPALAPALGTSSGDLLARARALAPALSGLAAAGSPVPPVALLYASVVLLTNHSA